MSPEIPLLNPLVLLGVVEKLQASEAHTMLNRYKPVSHPFPTATWEVLRGSRAIASPNVPNSEAHVVPRLGRESASAAFVYLREKKVFEPTTLHWLARAASNTADLGVKEKAEKAVMRELTDLNERFDNYAEYAIWQALGGSLVIDSPSVQANIDYKFLASHKPTASTGWASATTTQIVADVTAWKSLVSKNGRVKANEAFLTQSTMNHVFNAFTGAGTTPQGVMLSDRMKDEYYRTGVLSGFMGLDWQIQDAVFDPAGGAYAGDYTYPSEDKKFLADDKIILGNFTSNTPVELLEGPTADDTAPVGHTGKFTKSWKAEDPSARQVLLEWNFLPVVTRPEQIVAATVGA